MKNLTDRAYAVLTEALESGTLPAGRRVSQQELCDTFDISVSPLQGALKRLEGDGLIKIKPRSGIIVSGPDLGQHAENHELRRILELACIRHFAETHPTDQTEAQIAAIEAHRERAASGDDEMVRRNQSEIEKTLHGSIVRSKGNRTLWDTYQANMRRFRLIRPSRETLTKSQLVQSSDEHLSILRASLERQPDAAYAALDIHLTRSLERALMTRLHSRKPIEP